MYLPRQLPASRVEPLPGESFSSYVERLAATQPLPVPLITLLFHIGIIDDEAVKLISHGYGITLPPERLILFAHATRLSVPQARSLLLESYDGRVLDLTDLDPSDANSVRYLALREWAYFVGSHFCPDCIGEDTAWRLAWKVPWSFACVKHQRLLADLCPRCARRPGNLRSDLGGGPRFASMRPEPGRCMNPPAVGSGGPGRLALPCRQPLAQVKTLELQGWDGALQTQVKLDQAMQSGTVLVAGTPVPSLQYFQHLRSVCAMLLYSAFPEDLQVGPPELLQAVRGYAENRTDALEERIVQQQKSGTRGGPAPAAYRGAPQSAALMAAILPTAVEMLGSPSPTVLQTQLAWLVDRMRDRKANKVRNAVSDYNLSGPLLVAFDACLAPRAEFNRRHGVASHHSPQDGYQFTAAHIPQLLWKDEFEQRFKRFLAGSDITDMAARRALAVVLLRLAVPEPWSTLAHLLDLPANTGRSLVNKLGTIINGFGHQVEYNRMLHELAQQLSSNKRKTNYARRRKRMQDYTELPLDTWVALEHEHGTNLWATPTPAFRRSAAAWIWTEVTGGDRYLSPALSGDKSENLREVYRRHISEMSASILVLLQDQAARMARTCDSH